MNSEDLITYCGGFCGTCARYQGHPAFKGAASILAELADAHGFQHWMPDHVKEFNYAEFRKGLDFFADPDSWIICNIGCRGGQGGPPFCVRECCRDHGVDVCFECDDFPCDRTKPFDGIVERGDEYRRLGREEWLRRQAEKAERGYESHTGRYYQVQRSDAPLEK